MVGLTSYARFGHLDSADGSNILEVVAEHINRKHSPAKFFGLKRMNRFSLAFVLKDVNPGVVQLKLKLE